MKVLKDSQGNYDWVKIVVPLLGILFSLITALLGVLYAQQNKSIDNKADGKATKVKFVVIEDSLEKKVDNETLKQMLRLLEHQQCQVQEQLHKQEKVDSEILKSLERLNLNIHLLKQKIE